VHQARAKQLFFMNSKKMAQRRDWNIANIGVDALWNPDKLVGSIGHEGKYEGTERTTQVGLKGYVMRA